MVWYCHSIILLKRLLMSSSLWCKTVQRCREIKDEFKTLNGSIVPTCWDGVFPAHSWWIPPMWVWRWCRFLWDLGRSLEHSWNPGAHGLYKAPTRRTTQFFFISIYWFIIFINFLLEKVMWVINLLNLWIWLKESNSTTIHWVPTYLS